MKLSKLKMLFYFSSTWNWLVSEFLFCRIVTTSKLFVSFKENQFISLNRTEAYTLTDFIASCGGFFGLFMGISLLSVIEFIYFFTLRLCCKIRMRKVQRKTTVMWAQRKNIDNGKRFKRFWMQSTDYNISSLRKSKVVFINYSILCNFDFHWKHFSCDFDFRQTNKNACVSKKRGLTCWLSVS